MKNIIIMGLPCAGKGTISKRLADEHGLQHISTGNLIREEQALGSPIGKMADKIIDSGGYMPDSIVNTMVKEKIISSKNENGFVFDGFPRTKEQAKQVNAFLLQRNSRINNVIFIDVAENVAIERMKSRALSQNRKDDNESVFKSRLHEYNTQTMPVVNFFNQKGILQNVNGEQEKDVVFNEIVDIIS